MSRLTSTLLVCLMLALPAGLTAPAVQAADLAAPKGPVVLELGGTIARRNAIGLARFDRAMLEAVGMVEIVTTTAWTDGVKRFRGPLVRDVLKAVGADGTSVTAVALNDYQVAMPIADFDAYDVILAMEMDGQTMSVRDKGPIWIVWPRDQFPELDRPAINDRWVWQLRSLTVE